MKQTSTYVAANAAITAPGVVGHEDGLSDGLCVGVVDVNLHALIQVCLHNFDQLVDVVEDSLGSSKQEVLERHQACVRRGRVRKHLQNPNAVGRNVRFSGTAMDSTLTSTQA